MAMAIFGLSLGQKRQKSSDPLAELFSVNLGKVFSRSSWQYQYDTFDTQCFAVPRL
jgi:hypothetical protein